MLVEHTFVTTLEADEALRDAGEFLCGLGFTLRAGGPGELEAARGRQRASTSRTSQLPQNLKLVFDRGRVTLAAGILAPGGKDKPVHAEYMTALATALEALLVDRCPPEEAAVEWRRLDARLSRFWTRSRKVAAVILIVFAFAVIALVVAAIALS
jgi:hypothetical protein